MKWVCWMLAVAAIGLVGGGCGHAPLNAPITAVHSTRADYSFPAQRRAGNLDELLLVLTFSGGGTRAAALSCGVLEELARTRIDVGGSSHRLLDEVDIVSSVSGGSVTAAAFGLYGERAFQVLESAFLKRNVQGQLVSRALSPINCVRLCSPTFGRSDLAAEYYDKILFRGATFADLAARPAPLVVINAADAVTGARFEFSQWQFDMLCSDLGSYSVSRAVAASSAVPAVLSPITLQNYAGTCGQNWPEWLVLVQTATNRVSDRLAMRTAEVSSYMDARRRPFVHLVDGGLADNLGLRFVLDAVELIENVPDIVARYHIERVVKKVAIVCVNAHSAPEKGWDRRRAPPGILDLAVASSSIPIDRYSAETLAVVKEKLGHIRNHGSGKSIDRWKADFYLAVVSFDDLSNPDERRYFHELPTSFHLPSGAVDRLREVGGRLLRQSAPYQRLLRDLTAQSATSDTAGRLVMQ